MELDRLSRVVDEFEIGKPKPCESLTRQTVDLANGSEVVYIPKFLSFDDTWKWFEYINNDNHIPWTRPTLCTFGKFYIQVRVLPGITFNNFLLNRYKGDNDSAGWHSDDMKLYGLTPEIARVSLGNEHDFLLKKKFNQERRNYGEPVIRYKWSIDVDQHSFTLKHGSHLLMSGYTQRDWSHSVPKCADAGSTRISLTFRHVL